MKKMIAVEATWLEQLQSLLLACSRDYCHNFRCPHGRYSLENTPQDTPCERHRLLAQRITDINSYLEGDRR